MPGVSERLDDMETLFMVARGLKEPRTKAQDIYRQLVFNRFEDFIKTSFPIFSSFVGDGLSPLIQEFLQLRHSSPLLIDLGREFLHFFREKDTPIKERLPFLEELLLYEWAEIEVFNAPDEDIKVEFSWEGTYRLSASSRLLRFTYPVHRAEELSEQEIQEGKGSYPLLLYRDKSSEVKKTELTPFVFNFLEAICSGKMPAEALRNSGLDREEAEEVKPFLERFLKELIGEGILL